MFGEVGARPHPKLGMMIARASFIRIMSRLFSFHRKHGEQTLAFGIEPATCKYPLRLARYPALAECIQREVARKGTLKLLDVGCGIGKLKRCCPFPGVGFTGIDARRAPLEIALQSAYRHVLQSNLVEGLPFRDETFDVLVCSHVLEHLPQPENLVREARRVLRREGVLLVGVPMSWWWTRWLRIHLLPVVVPRKRPEALAANLGHVSFFTMSSLRALLSGFEIEDVRGFRFFSSRHLPLENWWWYYRLNTMWGRAFPRLTSEVNVVARKTSGLRPFSD